MLVMDIAETGGRAADRRWVPLAGEELLDRLRVTGRPRPPADPGLVQRLRDDLEEGLEEGGVDRDGSGTGGVGRGSRAGSTRLGPALVGPVGPVSPALVGPVGPAPIVVTKDRLTQALADDLHDAPTGFGERAPTADMACGALIDVLFRQLVTVGSIDDPMGDGLAALSIDPQQVDLVAWVEHLSASERGALEAEVNRQAGGLVDRWPRLHPSWLPRTQQSIRTALAGGAVELSARVDLAVGRPAADMASVALIELKSGMRRTEHRLDLHFYALIETLRCSVPPFLVATYYTRTGELDVDPVDEDLLVGSARRTVAGIRALRRHLAVGAVPRVREMAR